jgi:hypothetical protein
MWSYRHNIPERPRPPKPPLPVDYHPEDAIDWRPRTLPLTTARLPIESPVTTSQEIDPMIAKKKAKEAARGPGVIATVISAISRDRGATADETVNLEEGIPGKRPGSDEKYRTDPISKTLHRETERCKAWFDLF